MIDRFERFSFTVAEIYRCWHKIATDEMEEYGLKGSYAVYFTALFRHPDGLTAVQLGELCNRDKADVSRAASLLEKKGLLQRVSDSGKIYRTQLVLTETGRNLAEQINAKAAVAVEYASRGLPDDKRGVFYEALDLICENLQILSKEGLPEK